MSINKKYVQGALISLFASLSAVGASVNASEAESKRGFVISPMLGKYFPAKNRQLEDDNFYSLGLGYQFNERWLTELVYLTAETEVNGTDIDADVDMYRLDALRFFGGSDDKFNPYFVFGIGEGEFAAQGAEESDTFGNIGVGFQYAMSKHFSLRSDVRVLHGVDSGESDYLAGVGAIFRFGGGSDTASAAKKMVKNALPSADSDSDGVVDVKDKCPNSSANAVVDSAGCEIPSDTDKDGIVDTKDQCPNTKAGAKVGADGCYVVLKEAVSVSLNVNFASNSDRMLEDADAEIQKLASFLVQYPETNVSIEGHTDSSGAAGYNKSLSLKRAQAVGNALVNQFDIDASRVKTFGYGEEQPIVSNDTPENRAKNRRVNAVVKTIVEKIAE